MKTGRWMCGRSATFYCIKLFEIQPDDRQITASYPASGVLAFRTLGDGIWLRLLCGLQLFFQIIILEEWLETDTFYDTISIPPIDNPLIFIYN